MNADFNNSAIKISKDFLNKRSTSHRKSATHHEGLRARSLALDPEESHDRRKQVHNASWFSMAVYLDKSLYLYYTLIKKENGFKVYGIL